MITKKEIIEILEEKFDGFFQEWIPKKLWGYFIFKMPIQESAKAIIKKIKEEVSKPTKISFNTEIEKDFRKGRNEGRRK